MPESLKKHLINFMNQKKSDTDAVTFYKLINRFISSEIKHQGRDKTRGTLKTYQTTFNHLKDFETSLRYRVDFDTITLDFYYKFVTYLKKKGLKANTIGRNIKDIKTFMNEAV